MVRQITRWLGYGPAPVVGLEFRDDGVYVAIIRPPARVVGLGVARVPTGAIIDGRVRRPADVGASVEATLSAVHWRQPPTLRIAVPPEAWLGVDQPGLVTSHVYDGPAVEAVDRAVTAVGTIAVAEPILGSVVATVTTMTGRVGGIEPSPVSVARFLRLAQPAPSLRFVRLTESDRRWTLCDAIGSFEVEIGPAAADGTSLAAGDDPAHLEPIPWGSVDAEPAVKDAFAQPGIFTAAIGSALGAANPGITADLPWLATEPAR